ncbi:MAG: putative NTP pyrophosphohydrolase [Saliniramus fredricksonii]|uniref:8-oxo-dGTP pyrophosphatase MutT, NUDIX family n=1 Tax=Saliniramus fredricksonii TaxID=1653334 RepID=A0A0P8BSK4_9HYPH|nr:CoA pyrophosphatase [Saliniramus fredricksonii]KPQ12735.1 MAG: putative NTP pyrophosphohydrolase [Saliniramus fredricksonii]SCC82588.1 8-oxo-dGTP pyrophosphatase MutT, NUDIX family [Saliniramus fredricksonii]
MPCGRDAEDFVTRAAGRLHRAPPDFDAPRGDHDLNPDWLEPEAGRRYKPAAVLVPVIMRRHGLTIMLTHRGSALRAHSGQISFPGGKVDDGDSGPLSTALREAQEEIGLAAGHVELMGYGDAYRSTSGYLVTPVVALVEEGFRLSLNPFEVAEIFEVPVAFLMNPENHEVQVRLWNGRLRQYYAMPYDRHYIWGVTAGILRHLYERLYHP